MIYHFTTQLDGGGAETQLLELAKDLERDYGLPQTILYTSVNDVEYFEEKYDNIKFEKISRGFKPVKKDGVIHHVWIPDVFFFVNFLAFPKESTVIGVRNVYTIRSFRRFVQFFMLWRFDRFIGNIPIDLLNPSFRFLANRKEYSFIQNKLRFAEFCAPERDQRSLLFVGRLVQHKGILDLAEALNDTSLKVTVLGKGPLSEALKDSTALDVVGHVKDLRRFYLEHQFLILPSYYEGMPNVAFEALAHGCIPILSDIDVHKRWFSAGSDAFFFSVGDVQSLRNAIQHASSMSREEIKKIQGQMEETHRRHISVDVCEQYYFRYKNWFSFMQKRRAAALP